MKRIFTLTSMFLINASVLFAETATTSNYKSIITSIYMQAVMLGIVLAVITMIIVSLRDYDLIDDRIRKQKDVKIRRIIFFCLIILSPILWFYLTGTTFYDSARYEIMGINWASSDAWIGGKLLSAYTVNGTMIFSICYIIFFIFFSWIWAKFLHRYKAWTVIYSNHKIFGKISLNKKNK